MGPSNRNREKSAPPANRMDAVRSLLRTPPSPSTRSAAPAPLPPTPPHAEWSSPTFTRARARPSNLHSYLRSSPSFPLSQNHSHKAPSSTGGRSNASSGSGNAIPSYRSQQSESRSQRTQATQTQQSGEQLRNNASDGEGIQLGTFGAVSDMAIDTVDFLIRVLEDRKQELLVPTITAVAESPVASNSKSSKQKKETKQSRSARASSSRKPGSSSIDKKKKKKTKKKNPFDDEQYTESSDESDETLSSPTAETASASIAYPPPTAVVRSRSYEALVQLEGILEARHQQLMRDGILEPPVSASSANTTTGGAASVDSLLAENEEEDEAATAAMPGSTHMMTDIQEEIRKMHRSLRRQRSADTHYALDRNNFESLFATDARGA